MGTDVFKTNTKMRKVTQLASQKQPNTDFHSLKMEQLIALRINLVVSYLCLCDKEFAETVSTHEHEWMPENHVTRGGFNRFDTCKVAPKGISGGAYETCCGMDNFPSVGVKKTTHDGCCGPYGFNSDSQTCCNTYDGGYTVLNG